MNVYVLDAGISNNSIRSHPGVLGIYDKHSSINKAEHNAPSTIKYLLAGTLKTQLSSLH